MGPRILRQPNLRTVDLPWKGRSVSPLIDIHSSINALHKSVIDIMDVHNSRMDVYNSLMYIHNYGYPDLHYGEIVMDIYDLNMDVNNYIMAIYNCSE